MRLTQLYLAFLAVLCNTTWAKSQDLGQDKSSKWVLESFWNQKPFYDECSIALFGSESFMKNSKFIQNIQSTGRSIITHSSMLEKSAVGMSCQMNIITIKKANANETVKGIFAATKNKVIRSDAYNTLLVLVDLTLDELQEIAVGTNKTPAYLSNPNLLIWIPRDTVLYTTNKICPPEQNKWCLNIVESQGLSKSLDEFLPCQEGGSCDLGGKTVHLMRTSDPKDFTFTVGFIPEERPQVELLEKIARKMNSKIWWHTQPKDWTPSFTGSFFDLKFTLSGLEKRMAHGGVGEQMYSSLEGLGDFTFITHQAQSFVMSHKAGQLSNIGAMLWPLQPTVWALVFASVVTFSAFIFYLHGQLSLRGISDSILLVLMPLLSQSVDIRKISHIPRANIPILIWEIFALIILAGYSGILVSMLTQPFYDQEIESIDDCIWDDSCIFVLEQARYFRLYEGNPRYPWRDLWQKILQQGKENSLVDWYPEAIMKQNNLVTIFGGLLARYMMFFYSIGDKTYLHVAKESLWSPPFAIMFIEASPLTQLFDERILHLHAGGIIEKATDDDMRLYQQLGKDMQKRDVQDYILRVTEELEEHSPIPLKVILGPILVMAAGALIASLIFLGELVMKRNKARKQG